MSALPSPDNYARVYALATPEELADGHAWYPKAHDLMVRLGQTYGVAPDTVAAVTAALSPQLAWTENVIAAEDILRGRHPRMVLGANVAKARAILQTGATVAPCIDCPKVAAFTRALAGDYSAAVIDAHMAEAGLADVTAVVRLPSPQYRLFARALTWAAWAADVPTAHYQATVWLVWRRLYGPKQKAAARRGIRVRQGAA